MPGASIERFLSRQLSRRGSSATSRPILLRYGALAWCAGAYVVGNPVRPKSNVGGRPRTSPLILAARTASVSYRDSLLPEMLERVLLSGEVPSSFVPHVNALLEDASISLLAAVVEELHEKTGLQHSKLWSTLRFIAQRFGCRRDIWQLSK